MSEERPILEYRRIDPHSPVEAPPSRTGEWIVLAVFVLIDVIIFFAAT